MNATLKKYFLDWIESYESNIISFRMFHIDESLNIKSSTFEKENQYWRYILFKLDEAKINLKNDKYFDVKDIVENKANYPDNPATIHIDFETLQYEIDQYFDNYIKDQLTNNKLFKNAIQNHDPFINRLKEYPNLYEEMINIMLSSKDTINFDDTELEDHNGFTAKSIYEETNNSMPLKIIYEWLIKIEKAPVEASAYLKSTIKNIKKHSGKTINIM